MEIVNFGIDKTSFENVCKNLRYGTVVIGVYLNSAGTSYGVIGVAMGDYQAYYGVTYNSNNDVVMTKVLSRYGGTFSWKI